MSELSDLFQRMTADIDKIVKNAKPATSEPTMSDIVKALDELNTNLGKLQGVVGEKLEKAALAAPTAEAIQALTDAMEKVVDRLDNVEKATALRKSVAGQDGGTGKDVSSQNADDVRKAAVSTLDSALRGLGRNGGQLVLS